MEAGRALDAAIAEKVMGWTRIHPAKARDLDGYRGAGSGPTYRRLEAPEYGCESSRADGLVEVTGHCPRFSTDISAAWKVVERMRGRGQFFSLAAMPGAVYEAKLGTCAAFELSAPHVICLAALKAVGG
jgi:hypothetical protein